MDFSELQHALSSKSYEKIADICDELMLQVRSQNSILHGLSRVLLSPIATKRETRSTFDLNLSFPSGCFYWSRIPRWMALRDPPLGSHYQWSVSTLCNVISWVGLYFVLIEILGFCRNNARFLWKSIPTNIKESRPEVVAAWKIGQCLWTRDYAGVYGAIRGFEWSSDVADIVKAFEGDHILS